MQANCACEQYPATACASMPTEQQTYKLATAMLMKVSTVACSQCKQPEFPCFSSCRGDPPPPTHPDNKHVVPQEMMDSTATLLQGKSLGIVCITVLMLVSSRAHEWQCHLAGWTHTAASGAPFLPLPCALSAGWNARQNMGGSSALTSCKRHVPHHAMPVSPASSSSFTAVMQACLLRSETANIECAGTVSQQAPLPCLMVSQSC